MTTNTHHQPDAELVQLAPDALTPHPDNVRGQLGDLRDLTRSIRAVGVLEPLIITPATKDQDHDDQDQDRTGEWWILAGHRRHAAALAAEVDTVPCIIRADLTGTVSTITTMWTENTQRRDLTATEAAAAVEQLALAGLSDTAIARTLGATRGQVTKQRTLAASDTAMATVDRYDLTLEQALIVADFDDDPDAVKNLVACAVETPRRFDHLASQLRQRRDDAAAYAAKIDELQAQGLRILNGTEARTHDDTDRVGLWLLTNCDTDADERTAITAEDHAKCPGHVGVLDPWDHDRVTWYCDQPDNHQRRHTTTNGPVAGERGGPMTDQQKAERREVIANNKAWDAATPVRLDHVRRLLTRKTPPAGTLRYVVTETMATPETLGRGDDTTLADLVGAKDDGPSYTRAVATRLATEATDKALPLVLLAQWAAALESGLGRHTWRSPNPRAARWLEWLTTTGYELADIEQHVIDLATSSGEATAA